MATPMDVQTSGSGQSKTTTEATTASAPSSGRTGRVDPPPVELKKWSGVALWRYKIQVEDCSICHNHIMEPCTHCQADATSVDNTNCQIAHGQCSHVFHLHCIDRWLRKRNNCPLDQQEWEYQAHPIAGN